MPDLYSPVICQDYLNNMTDMWSEIAASMIKNHLLYQSVLRLVIIRKEVHLKRRNLDALIHHINKLWLMFDNYMKYSHMYDSKVNAFMEGTMLLLINQIIWFLEISISTNRRVLYLRDNITNDFSTIVEGPNSLDERHTTRNFRVMRNIKSKRSNYPKDVTFILRSWIELNKRNPYPSDDDKRMLSLQTGLDLTQINNWFINARRRIVPYLK